MPHGASLARCKHEREIKHLDDNLGAVTVRLTADDLAQIDAVLPAGAASGPRYHAQGMQAIGR
jgi:hypothetical protein